jgi:hypothetical protein
MFCFSAFPEKDGTYSLYCISTDGEDVVCERIGELTLETDIYKGDLEYIFNIDDVENLYKAVAFELKRI